VQSRRVFLQQMSRTLLAASLPLPWVLPRFARASNGSGSLGDIDPLAELAAGTLGSTDFNGDDATTPHELFWDKAGALARLGGIPAATERVRVCIVGGGIAGLSAAYRLADLSPVILEGAPRLGGNSKGEVWNGVAYSLGAAYVAKPDPGSPTRQLLEELKLWDQMRPDANPDSSFWEGVSDPSRAAEFRKARAVLEDVWENSFPEIPFKPDGQLTREAWDALDRIPFKSWFENAIGGPLHPHVEEFLQMYCWSSFAGEFDTISALQGLNFFCSDLHGIFALPGGNSAIARAFAASIREKTGVQAFRTGSYAVDVTTTNEGVRVCYHTPGGKLRTLTADVCIVACPKWVARYVVSGLSAEQNQAMRGISYRAYLTANVLVRGRIQSPGYDIFRLEGQVSGGAREELRRRPWADFVCASWAAHDSQPDTTLTLYRPLPYQGAEQFLFNPGAHDKHRDQVQAYLPDLCRQLGIDQSRIAGVRHTRWGHALPHAAAGLLARGIPQAAAQPIGGRIFFANQDNWASPCIETATQSAFDAAAAARAFV
jgi:glycine/D-amino acid oxidase-like deaminating enzyme